MRSRPTNQKLLETGTASEERSIAAAALNVFNRMLEVLRICRRAGDAAHYYEELKPQSDQALEEKGLKRSDLPRAAFEKLSDEA